jgi:hypothetical protein
MGNFSDAAEFHPEGSRTVFLIDFCFHIKAIVLEQANPSLRWQN